MTATKDVELRQSILQAIPKDLFCKPLNARLAQLHRIVSSMPLERPTLLLVQHEVMSYRHHAPVHVG